MALTDSFLVTCRGVIDDLDELTTYRDALANIASASRASRVAAWHAAYSPTTTGQSPAYLLRKAIRDTVNAQADIAGTLGPLERESAYSQLAGEYVSTYPKPLDDNQEQAELEKLIRLDRLS